MLLLGPEVPEKHIISAYDELLVNESSFGLRPNGTPKHWTQLRGFGVLL